MADEPRESTEQEAPDYEPPRAEEVSADGPEATATGATGTPADEVPSDRNLKTGFAEVDVDAVLAAVRATRIAVHRQPRR